MRSRRIAFFISHKVALHGDAARRIKDILESRTERLDVFVCEDVEAGERWRDVIAKNISRTKILLVLWPGPDTDVKWIQAEIEYFTARCRNGRLVVLKAPGDPLPGFLSEVQVIDAIRDDLRERFLAPLYRNPKFTRSRTPLNGRVLQDDIERDAQEIEDALSGVVRPQPEFYRESLIVDTTHCDVARDGFSDVRVSVPDGCRKILNWNRSSFSWKELRERAEEDEGKGTFWVNEMERVILDVAHGDYPGVMTSTFRGRGSVAGLIFRPHLDHVEFVDDKRPVRVHFVFHQVLAPELVRGPGPIGDVFNILYIATRVRWEVLNPFLVKRFLTKGSHRFEIPEDERNELIEQIGNSVRVIDQEAERHGVAQLAANAFEDKDRDKVEKMLAERESLREAILDAADRRDFAGLMAKLARALDLNTAVVDLLAGRFQELVRKDRTEVQALLAETATPAPPAEPRGASPVEAPAA
jgi:TIR domain